MLDFIQIIIDTFSARLNYAKNIDIDEDLVLGRFNLVYDRSREVEGFYSSLSSTKEDTYWAAFKKQVITSLKKDNQEYGFMTLEEVNYYGQRIEYSKWKLKRLRYQLKAELHNKRVLLGIFNNYSRSIHVNHWMSSSNPYIYNPPSASSYEFRDHKHIFLKPTFLHKLIWGIKW